MLALTSLPPSPQARRLEQQLAALRSWRAAGLEVHAFQGAAEMGRVALWAGGLVRLEEAPLTPPKLWERPLVPIKSMLDWAAERGSGQVLVINSDIELELGAEDLGRIAAAARGGLAYFIRRNYNERHAQAELERHGIDAFLLDACDTALLEASTLAMGVPWWDYWLPWSFLQARRPLLSIDWGTYHRIHPQAWKAGTWLRCAQEFQRAAIIPTPGDLAYDDWTRMSVRIRGELAARSRPLAQGVQG